MFERAPAGNIFSSCLASTVPKLCSSMVVRLDESMGAARSQVVSVRCYWKWLLHSGGGHTHFEALGSRNPTNQLMDGQVQLVWNLPSEKILRAKMRARDQAQARSGDRCVYHQCNHGTRTCTRAEGPKAHSE